MVDRVGTAFLRLLFGIDDSVATRQLGNLARCAGDTNDGRVEKGCVHLEDLQSVPFRIDRDEQSAHLRQLVR